MRYIEAGIPVAFPTESTSHVASAFTSGEYNQTSLEKGKSDARLTNIYLLSLQFI